MSTLKLRQIGDTVVLILPKTLLEQLSAKSGDSLKYSFEDRKLVIKPKRKLRRLPKYDLSGLLLEHKQIMVRFECREEAERQYSSQDFFNPACHFFRNVEFSIQKFCNG